MITVVNGNPTILDIDSGLSARESVKQHPREKAWSELSRPVEYAYVVKDQDTDDGRQRRAVVSDVRDRMDVPCGN